MYPNKSFDTKVTLEYKGLKGEILVKSQTWWQLMVIFKCRRRKSEMIEGEDLEGQAINGEAHRRKILLEDEETPSLFSFPFSIKWYNPHQQSIHSPPPNLSLSLSLSLSLPLSLTHNSKLKSSKLLMIQGEERNEVSVSSWLAYNISVVD